MKSHLVKVFFSALIIVGALTTGICLAVQDDTAGAAKRRAQEIFQRMQGIPLRVVPVPQHPGEFLKAVEAGDASVIKLMNEAVAAQWRARGALLADAQTESPAVQQALYSEILKNCCGYEKGGFFINAHCTEDGNEVVVSATYTKPPHCISMEHGNMRETAAGFACYVRAFNSCEPTFASIKTADSSGEYGLCMLTAFRRCAKESKKT